jgi:hypothetical protein
LNLFRSSLASLVVCSSFASSMVRADDCHDSLMAESCACRSEVRSEREQLKSSDKKASKGTRMGIAKQAKRPLASSTPATATPQQ